MQALMSISWLKRWRAANSPELNAEETTMRRPKTDARLLCFASIIVVTLGGCSHQGTKPKTDENITDSTQPSSTSEGKKSRLSQNGRSNGRWMRKKDKALASGLGSAKGLSQYDNLWDRLFDLYDLPPIEHDDIDRELEWFVSHPTYIDRVQSRAEPFLYSIVKQVEKHEIPGEIALLPVIESAFQPHAVSPANAAGIWQFIPSTGKIYGLKRSRSYDGRRDVYASTKAAIKYLKKLHTDFNGDWLLAIAAYNCGEGAVGRAIQKNLARNLPTDFWSLDLPQETRSYVPRLLAVAKLFASADQYGIDLHRIPNSAKFKPVKVNSQLNLALAADAADIPLEKFHELNPGFKGQYADVEGSYHLFIPAEKKAREFREELARLTLESERTSFTRAKSLSDESPIEERAAEFAPATKSSPATYRAALQEERNSGLGQETAPARGATVRPVPKERKEPSGEREVSTESPIHSRHERESVEPKSQAHNLERSSKDRRETEAAPTSERIADPVAKKALYTVQRGETLWAVARKHSVEVGQLAKWNSFPETTAIKAGQTLLIWNKDAGKKLPLMNSGIRPSQATKYTVKEGDTLFSISRRFKVSVADLRKWNGANVEKQIHPGKFITVQLENE
jgi:membrane-bound lytic murein transglycosylase D